MSGPSKTAAAVAGEPFTDAHSTVSSPALEASQPHREQQADEPNTADGRTATCEEAGPPPPCQSIPPGAVVIRHVGNTNFLNLNRKRGRPSKYGPDGGMPTGDAHANGSASDTVKKGRGRPRGSLNETRPEESLVSTGREFTSYVLHVNEGEDIFAKIMYMYKDGPRAICVMAASGTISTATLSRPTISSGVGTYEGQFDIVSLSGLFLLPEAMGQKSRTGGMTISLMGPDGRVFGGSVAGLLIAASPIRILVGSFVLDGY